MKLHYKICCLFLFFGILIFPQNNLKKNISKEHSTLLKSVKLLDEYMQNNDPKITTILCEDVSFGHSNGWVQNYEDFKKDIDSETVQYQSIKQIELKELKIRSRFANIRRIIAVKGIYKKESFELKLSVLEFWLKKDGLWKLWSRQGVSLK